MGGVRGTDRLMQLALIVPAPFDAVSGGYAYDRRIVAGLRAAGHTVAVVELPGVHPLADDVSRDAARAAMDGLPGEIRPVVDGLALPAFAGLDGVMAARDAGAIIHHPTALETGFGEAERSRLLAVEKRLLPLLARIIVTSEATGERLAADFGVTPERIKVVIPGTDDAPRSFGSGGPGCTIISVGALVPRKGHDVLLRALGRLFDLDWRLTIVGSPDRDPVHARTLAALAEDLGIAGRVEFAGELTDPALEALWRGADIFALATHWEGYGMAIAEALKRGLPVAVSGGGAVGSLVPPEAGAVCQPGDHVNLSKALRRLIFDATLRRHVAEAAWQVGQTFPDWPTQVGRFAQALTE
jgi:glycosyltransferase involved in cell wall biosynthesis